MFGLMAAAQFAPLLRGLRSGDESVMLLSVSELCEQLLMGSEASLAYMDHPRFSTALCGLLLLDYNLELQLLAARAFTQMVDVLPHSAGSVVASGAVPLLLKCVAEMSFIDVAEQVRPTGPLSWFARVFRTRSLRLFVHRHAPLPRALPRPPHALSHRSIVNSWSGTASSREALYA